MVELENTRKTTPQEDWATHLEVQAKRSLSPDYRNPNAGPISKVIVFEDKNGQTQILQPFIKTSDRTDLREQEVIDRAYTQLPEGYKNAVVRSREDVPKDRTFRDALTLELTVHMGKAREIHKSRMRLIRRPLLEELDVAYQRADEAGDNAAKKDIAAKKQALRDVTAHPGLGAATTSEELKSVWPEILGEKK